MQQQSRHALHLSVPATHCKRRVPATARGHLQCRQSAPLLLHHLNPSHHPHHLLWSRCPHHCLLAFQSPHPVPQDHHHQRVVGAYRKRRLLKAIHRTISHDKPLAHDIDDIKVSTLDATLEAVIR